MPVSANDEFTTLATLYGAYPVPSGSTDADRIMLTAPLYYVRVGYVNNKAILNAGYYSYYASNTVDSDTFANGLKINYNSISPQNKNYRYGAISIRCLAR